ncbi:unnamed protein product [Rotaria sordida]|uniref:Uncharacterized protein n=1 Tax=Rotaria sordida TaxID=392033 RepID=A0A814CWJ1_9BILA|nr:unnamed protein product [Rotaria sordida]
MGSTCSGNKDNEQSMSYLKNKPKISLAEQSTQSQSDNFSRTNTHTYAPEDILDDDFEAEIIKATAECMASMHIDFYDEHNPTIDDMYRSTSEPYRIPRNSDYPDKNEMIINETNHRKATYNEVKQQLCDRINERIKASFELQTADWEPSSREMAHSFIIEFIANLVDEKMNHSKLK